MSDEIFWWVELVVQPGQLANFEALTGEMVDFTRRESGVLSYARFIGDDSNSVHVYERYANSAAAAAHIRAFAATFGARFQGMVERKRFMVVGTPDDALKQILDSYGAIYLKPFVALSYWT